MRAPLLPCSLLLLLASAPSAPAASSAGSPVGDEIQVVRLSGTYAENPDPGAIDPFTLLAGGGQAQKSFFRLCEFVDELAADEALDHVLFDLASPSLGLGAVQIAQLQRHLDGLRAAGKRTWAWLENGGSPHFGVAARCDRVLMAEFGTLDLPSPSMGTLHFKDAMDWIGVGASTTRVGEFKGATEPYTESHMSAHLREHYRAMLESMNRAGVERLAAGRDMSPEALRACQAQRLFDSQQALEAGLVDELVPYGGVRQRIGERLGEDLEWREMPTKTRQAPSFFELFGELMEAGADSTLLKPGVAVLHLSGMIVDGSARQPGQLVAGPTVALIRQLHEDDKVQGVVVRVDSPGGSATASEAIRLALAELAAEKPLVFSMGALAASGGYWITCIGEPILAEAQTITGSIGVLALKLDYGRMLETVGVSIEEVQLDESAGMMSPERGWTTAELERVQAFCDRTYGRFLDLAAGSRGMTPEAVDAIAGGRVWSGAQAVELGLVDRLGGLDAALSEVRERCGLEADAPVAHHPEPLSPFELLGFMGTQEEIRSLPGLDALRWLERAGFRLQTVRGLLLESLRAESRGPRAWLLAAQELRVR